MSRMRGLSKAWRQPRLDRVGEPGTTKQFFFHTRSLTCASLLVKGNTEGVRKGRLEREGRKQCVPCSVGTESHQQILG